MNLPGILPISSKLAETRISQFMTRKPFYATKTTTVEVAIKTMITHGVSGLPVIDESDRCIGLYSELDAMIQGASQPLNSKIRFKSPAITAKPDETFKEVLLRMAQKKLRRLPIVDDKNKLMGIVARRDLLKAFMADQEAQP